MGRSVGIDDGRLLGRPVGRSVGSEVGKELGRDVGSPDGLGMVGMVVSLAPLRTTASDAASSVAPHAPAAVSNRTWRRGGPLSSRVSSWVLN
ncbi:hypothetical protein [Streptomyces sp. NPDC042319]|uniref:hypothetical protein n=1 Tax=Streptomyces sp. NPDC042319 TaxID=3154332 RepID=UPI0033D218C0